MINIGGDKLIIKNRVLDFLEGVLNPQTQKGLFVERRVIDVKADNNVCHIVLNSSELSESSLIQLKQNIIQKLGDLYHAKDIHISFQSSFENTQTSAELQVGHERAKGKRQLDSVSNILAIASGKGGVGKSTVTANLALALKREGLAVGIVDADVYGPSLPMIFGKRSARPIASEDKKIIPIEAWGIPFISFGFFVEEENPVIWRGPMLGGVINQFLFDVQWPKLDYLLIDLPPGTGDIPLSLSQMIQLTGAIIVSTPQDVALLDAKKGLKMLQKVNVPILGMIQNMSYFVGDDKKKYHIFGKNGVEEEAKKLEIPFLGEVPMEMALRECSDRGTPYMGQEEYQEREVWRAFSAIARRISDGPGKKDEKGFFQRLLKRD